MIVRPLGITSPLWPNFVSVCKEVLGIDPVAGLDSARMSEGKVASFMGCLDLENKPRHALTTLACAEHVSALFLVIVEPKTIDSIINLGLQATIIHRNDELCAVLLSGTMREWHHSIVKGSARFCIIETRKMCNIIYTYLKNEGFYLWDAYETENNLDGTFILKRN